MQRRLSRANAHQDSSPVKGQALQNNIALGNMFEILNNSHHSSDNNINHHHNRALSNNRKSILHNGHLSHTNESSR